MYKYHYEMLSTQEIDNKYPGIYTHGERQVGLYDPSGSVLIPSRCLSVIQVYLLMHTILRKYYAKYILYILTRDQLVLKLIS